MVGDGSEVIVAGSPGLISTWSVWDVMWEMNAVSTRLVVDTYFRIDRTAQDPKFPPSIMRDDCVLVPM